MSRFGKRVVRRHLRRIVRRAVRKRGFRRMVKKGKRVKRLNFAKPTDGGIMLT